MEESIVYAFNEKLTNSSKPHVDLARFFYVAMEEDTKSLDVRDIKIFGRFVKLYGRDAVFTALLVVIGYTDVSLDNYSRLLGGVLSNMLKDKQQRVQYEILAETEYGKRILAEYE